MKKTTRRYVLLACATLMLSACQDKPLAKFASINGEMYDVLYEAMTEADNNPSLRHDPDKAWEMIGKATEPYKKKLEKEVKRIDGTEIETAATDDTGLTIVKPFTITKADKEQGKGFGLVATVTCDETYNRAEAIGYDGDEPIILFDTDFDETDTNTWEVTIYLMKYNSKLVGRLEKVVFTTDSELIQKLKYDENRFDQRFPH